MIAFSKRNLNRILRLARLLENEEERPDSRRKGRCRGGTKRGGIKDPGSPSSNSKAKVVIRVKDQTVYPVEAVAVDPSVRFSEYVQIGDPEGEIPWNVNTSFWSTFVGCQVPFRNDTRTDPHKQSYSLFRFCSCSVPFIDSILDQAHAVHSLAIHADLTTKETIRTLILAKAESKHLYVDSLCTAEELDNSVDSECTSFTFSSRVITQMESLIRILRSFPNLTQLQLHIPRLTPELANTFHELEQLSDLTIKVRELNSSSSIDVPTHVGLVALTNGLKFECSPLAISTPLHKRFVNVNISICAIANGLVNLIDTPSKEYPKPGTKSQGRASEEDL